MGGRLSREPGWVIDSALRQSDSNVFAEHLTNIGAYEIESLKLGKKTNAQYAQLTELHKKIDRYAYGAPSVPFSDQDVDQARAAGVLIEFENARPVIADRAVYRELVKQAIGRHLQQQTARVEQQEADRKQPNPRTRHPRTRRTGRNRTKSWHPLPPTGASDEMPSITARRRFAVPPRAASELPANDDALRASKARGDG